MRPALTGMLGNETRCLSILYERWNKISQNLVLVQEYTLQKFSVFVETCDISYRTR